MIPNVDAMAVTTMTNHLGMLIVWGDVDITMTRPAKPCPPQKLLAEFEGTPSLECYRVLWGKGRERPFRGTCALFEMLWHTILGEPAILSPRFTMTGIVAIPFRERPK